MAEKERVGEVFPGQHWIELHGAFTPLELKAIALRLEKGIEKIRADVNKNRHI